MSPDADSTLAWVLALGLSALLCYRLPAVRDTTLWGPWLWTQAALLALAGVELLIDFEVVRGTRTLEALRFAAAMTTLCPAMAALGAKRPQDRPWQFVVITLLVLLWLPPLETWLLRPGERLHVSQVWRWFLLVLLLLGTTNYLPTRFWLAALFALAGQICLMPAGLPFSLPAEVSRPGVALALIAAAIVPVCLGWPRPRVAQSNWERVWFDFRDMYGAVWGLRVLERLEALRTAQDWPVAFRWHGVETNATEPLSDSQQAAVNKSLRSILWRFVSRRWIAQRLGEPLE